MDLQQVISQLRSIGNTDVATRKAKEFGVPVENALGLYMKDLNAICYPLILKHVTDPRNFVKKAVNWAIREIGKRNVDLKNRCIELCEEILNIDDPTARWIAKDALRELTSPDVKMRKCPKSVYDTIPLLEDIKQL